MNSVLPPLRRPLQILFKPPAWPGDWRLTGKFHCLPPGQYGAYRTFEWMDDLGGRIWLSAESVDFVVAVDKRRDIKSSLLTETASLFLGKLLRRAQ